MRILLTGANGFIAKHLCDYMKQDGYDVTLLHRGIADITQKDEVNNFFKDNYFKAVIHCASVGGNRNIPDAPDCVKNNLSMFYNLMEHQDKFSKFINLGSGAELDRSKNINSASNLQNCFPVDDYGLSKNIIARLGSQIDKFYNVRIFNVFSHEELETRMIKNNILNYINKVSYHIDFELCFLSLLRNGINVEMFERENRAGGLLTYGIPGFKLNKEAVARRVDWLVGGDRFS
jgi:nucleoside-diphosphate-sugar epimerase